uniref:GCN5-related N-acetyltransferase n=1 Tax=Geobacter sp. (strain M21) TaxID=443144 RepID=C6E991_GEOSM
MIEPFVESDIHSFIALAKEERWICGTWEFQFLLRSFPKGCLAWREEGKTIGYITSLRHENSGWIGNLLVTSDARRRGIGAKLMEGALDALLSARVATVWLTASAKGVGLYRKLGFLPIDSINRWKGTGRNESGAERLVHQDLQTMREVDRAGWGDRRDGLLDVTIGRGWSYCGEHSFLCCQPWEEGTQIGPWGALMETQAELLLERALDRMAGPVFLDVPAGNLAAAAMLTKRKFSIAGSNTLMYLGAQPSYDNKRIFALASMGSMG